MTWAYSDGVAPEPEVGREARRVLESFVAGLSDAERRKTRLAAEAIDPLLAKAAWAAGDLAAARQRAEAALAAAAKAPENWDRGNVLHEMNILLGRVALEREDLAEAARRLLEAGATPGSPQLDSFGPDWTLASDLLARGDRKTVLAYVDRVGAFWEHRDRLATWKKTLEEGGTPEFVPKRRVRGKAKEPAVPPAEPPSAGPAKSIVGLWESVNKSDGGIGNAIEFRTDGRVLTRLVVLVDIPYRVEKDRLVLGDASEAQALPLGEFDGDKWTFAPEGAPSVTKRRVGVATPDASPVVGTWTYPHPTGPKAFERYRPDGWLSLRVLMPGQSSGTYTVTGADLRMTFTSAPAQDFTATLTGDRLRLVSKDDKKEREYRYAGEKPWYDLGAGP